MRVLEIHFVLFAFALTLNPSPKRGEGLQSGSLLPFWEKGLGDEGRLSPNVSEVLN